MWVNKSDLTGDTPDSTDGVVAARATLPALSLSSADFLLYGFDWTTLFSGPNPCVNLVSNRLSFNRDCRLVLGLRLYTNQASVHPILKARTNGGGLEWLYSPGRTPSSGVDGVDGSSTQFVLSRNFSGDDYIQFYIQHSPYTAKIRPERSGLDLWAYPEVRA